MKWRRRQSAQSHTDSEIDAVLTLYKLNLLRSGSIRFEVYTTWHRSHQDPYGVVSFCLLPLPLSLRFSRVWGAKGRGKKRACAWEWEWEGSYGKPLTTLHNEAIIYFIMVHTGFNPAFGDFLFSFHFVFNHTSLIREAPR